VLEKVCWNIFTNTGDIHAYLCYKMLKKIGRKGEEVQKKPAVGKQVFSR